MLQQCIAVYCIVLQQCIALCCRGSQESMLQHNAIHCNRLQRNHTYRDSCDPPTSTGVKEGKSACAPKERGSEEGE